jgi:uncharacterized protein YoxC
LEPQVTMAWSLVGILVVHIVVLLGGIVLVVVASRRVGQLLHQWQTLLQQMQEELTAVLEEAHSTLQHVQKLTQTADKLVQEEVGPTLSTTRTMLTQVESSTRSLRDGAKAFSTVLSRVEMVSNPILIAKASRQAWKVASEKLSLLATGIGAGIRTLVGDQNRPTNDYRRSQADGTEQQ